MTSCLAIVLLGCASRDVPERRPEYIDVREAMALVSNEDISWNGNIVGIYPEIKGGSALGVLARGDEVTDELLSLLTHRDRFVAAHVLLWHIHPVDGVELGKDWNGLSIDFSRNGKVYYDSADISHIYEFWSSWRKNNPSTTQSSQ